MEQSSLMGRQLDFFNDCIISLPLVRALEPKIKRNVRKVLLPNDSDFEYQLQVLSYLVDNQYVLLSHISKSISTLYLVIFFLSIT